ncbi:MAG: hypothetical protein IBX55_10640 [Methyloprofundus sp.]|nr:hypothetical protein [Methyloprofundus sp.]
MEQVLERLVFGVEQNQDLKGLALIPAPTGFGKTYVTCDFIAKNIERIIEQKRKVIFVTPLLKNLPIDTLEKAFERHKKIELFEQVFLRLPSRFDSFKDNFKDVKALIPDGAKGKGFRTVESFLELNKRANTPTDQAWFKLYDQDKRFREAESLFRQEIKKELFQEKSTKAEKKKTLSQLENNWVYKLYPEAMFDDKCIVMMSMTKFLMPFSTLVDAAYPLVEKLKAGTLVIMDEVDACKQDIQNVIIERGLDHQYDPLSVLKTTYKHLTTHTHSAFFLKDSEKRKQKIANNGWQSIPDTINFLTGRMEEVYDHFELGMQLKTVESEQGRHFLFSDYRTIQVSEKRLDVTTDKDEGVNCIKANQNSEQVNYKLNALVGGVQTAIKMLKRNISNVAQNYLENKNIDSGSNRDEMLREQALKTVMSEYAIEPNNPFRQVFFDARLQYATNIRFKPPHDENFSGFCAQGFSLFELSDSPEHDTYTALAHYAFTDTPENYLAYLCDKARVIGLSATAEFNNPLGNFYFSYLRNHLQENFLSLTDEEHARIQTEFNERTKGYAQIQLDVGVVRNESDFEQALLELLNDDTMVEQLMDEVDQMSQGGKPDYTLQRYINLFTSMKQFIEVDDLYGYLALFSALPKENNRAFDIEWVERVFNHLAQKTPDLVLKVLQSTNYSEDLNEVQALLASGKRVFVISSYATLGAGQNLQFPIPENLKDTVIKINDLNPSTEMDFNGLYLDDVTQILPNPRTNDESYALKNAIDRVFKIMYLYETGEISSDSKNKLVKHSLKALYDDKAFNKTPLKPLQSYNNAVAAKLVQAIGRLCRTNKKAPRIQIRLSEAMIHSLQQAELPATTPLLPEVEAILSLAPITSDQARADQRLITQAENRNQKVAYYISRMLGNITSPSHIESWQKLREYCLIKPCFEILPADHQSDLYLELPLPQNNYWYKSKDPDLKGVEISERYQGGMNTTDTLTQALNQLMKLPGLTEYFDQRGWATHHKKSKYWLVPVLWQNIYQGALGEEIGRYIFERLLGYPLSALPSEYHEVFDFKLKDSVYIDFKLWLNYANEEALAYRTKVREKMNKIGAKKLLVINIWGEQQAHPINMGTNIIEIPGLVANGNLNLEAIKLIKEVYGDE